MTKKGHNTSVRDDLFAYLLGKQTPKEVKTATGTTISITDATKAKIVSLTLSKERMQDGTPTPENPVEIKTVKGYRNLFDKNNVVYRNQYILNDNGVETYDVGGGYTKMYIEVEPSTSYYISGLPTSGSKRIYYFDENKTFISRTSTFSENYKKVITPSNCKYIDIQYNRVDNDFNKYMINKSDVLLPYVPYGTNWIYTTVSNGTDTNYYTIPLNNNEIAGISDYKDELIVDSNGHCWLNKKTGKLILNGTENWVKSSNTNVDRYAYNTSLYKTSIYSLCNYFKYGNINNYSVGYFNSNVNVQLLFNFASYGTSTLEQWKEWLSTHNLEVIQPLATPQLIDLEYDVDVRLFNGVNNISNSEDMDMTLKYY